MKRILMIFLTSAISYIASAESVKYNYDKSGNRIKREIVINTRSSQNDEEEDEVQYQQDVFSDILSGKDIQVYPDQKKGCMLQII